MKGRLQVAAKHAQGLDHIAADLQEHVDTYAGVLASFSGGHRALISRLEESPDALEDSEARQFAESTRQLAHVTRESMAALASVVDSVSENAKLSRVLRAPSQRLLTALAQFGEATAAIDDLDRRLESLGVPKPPPDWEPEPAEEIAADDDLDGGSDDLSKGDATEGSAEGEQ